MRGACVRWCARVRSTPRHGGRTRRVTLMFSPFTQTVSRIREALRRQLASPAGPRPLELMTLEDRVLFQRGAPAGRATGRPRPGRAAGGRGRCRLRRRRPRRRNSSLRRPPPPRPIVPQASRNARRLLAVPTADTAVAQGTLGTDGTPAPDEAAADRSAGPAATVTRHELVFVDTAVPDCQKLLDRPVVARRRQRANRGRACCAVRGTASPRSPRRLARHQTWTPITSPPRAPTPRSSWAGRG